MCLIVELFVCCKFLVYSLKKKSECTIDEAYNW